MSRFAPLSPRPLATAAALFASAVGVAACGSSAVKTTPVASVPLTDTSPFSTVGTGTAGSTASETTSAVAGLSPRQVIATFTSDLARRDYDAACALVDPSARPGFVAAHTRESLSVSACAGALARPAGQKLARSHRLSATALAHGTLSTISDTQVAFQSAPPALVSYTLTRLHGVWVIFGT